MAVKEVMIGEAVRFGWETLRKNFVFILGVTLLGMLVIFIPSGLAEATRDSMRGLSLLFTLVNYLVNGLVLLGMINITLKLVDGEKPVVADLFACLPRLLSYIVSALLYSLLVFVGILLLVVPGVIWSLMFMFYAYFIVDRDRGPIEALKDSKQLTAGAKGQLFLFLLAILGINLLGALALLVGLVITIPLSALSVAYVYRKLQAQSEGAGSTELPKVVS